MRWCSCLGFRFRVGAPRVSPLLVQLLGGRDLDHQAISIQVAYTFTVVLRLSFARCTLPLPIHVFPLFVRRTPALHALIDLRAPSFLVFQRCNGLWLEVSRADPVIRHPTSAACEVGDAAKDSDDSRSASIRLDTGVISQEE